MLARADLLRRLGGFDESLHHIADWDLWIRLTEAGRPAACPEPLVAYMVHDANMHRTAIDSAASERAPAAREARASSLPGRFDPVVFRGWIADGQAHAGRPGRAALTHAVHRAAPPEPADARRAVGLGAARRRLRRARRDSEFDGRRAGLAVEPPIARTRRPAANELGSSSSSSARPSSSRSDRAVIGRPGPAEAVGIAGGAGCGGDALVGAPVRIGDRASRGRPAAASSRPGLRAARARARRR